MIQRLRQEIIGGLIAVLIIILSPLSSFGYTVNYTYDEAYRLKSEQHEDGMSVIYSYDEVGNRTSKIVAKPLITATAGSGGSISPSGTVLVTYGTDQRFDIIPNINNYISDVIVDGVSVGQVSSYTFTNVTTSHTIEARFLECSFVMNPASQFFTQSAGSGSISVTAPNVCAWTAESSVPWITITSTNSSTGNGTVSYFVSANSNIFLHTMRTGSINVAGQIITITQAAVAVGIGGLDPTFNGTGSTIYPGPTHEGTFGTSVATQTDGKTVVVGGTDNGDVLILRYDADGALDNSFGTDGVITYDGAAHGWETGYAVAIQPDGKILVAGIAVTDTNRVLVLRYNTDGTVDNSFGTNGMITYSFTSNNPSWPGALAIQPDGKIVLTGTTEETVCDGTYCWPTGVTFVSRFNTDWTFDNAFGTNGSVTYDSDGYLGNSVAIQADGEIVVPVGMAILRYNADGMLKGILNPNSFVDAMALQSDGKILAVGEYGSSILLTRYNADGSLDSTFGTDGVVSSNLVSGWSWASSVALQQDGKIVVAGNTDTDIVVLRYNPDGTLDNAFGSGGMITYNDTVGWWDTGYGMAIQSDGKIVVVGERYDGTLEDLLVLRINGGVSVKINKTGTGSGTVTSAETPAPFIDCGITCGRIYNSGASLSLSATADAGSTFTGWSGDCTGAASLFGIDLLKRDMSCTAIFTLNTYTLTSSAGPNGSVFCTPNPVDYNARSTCAIDPNAGYHIAAVMVDGESQSATSPYVFDNVIATHSVTASFLINTYAITSSAGTGGNITPSGSITVDYGTSQTYTITPNVGCAISDVLIDGISAGPVAIYTFSSISSSHTLSASFRTLNTLSVSVETSKGRKLSAIKTYLFKDTGIYTNLTQTTDLNGQATFSTSALAAGNYKIRADYLGYQFWSSVFALPNTGAATVLIPEQTATLSITPVISGIKTYLFTSAGTYVNKTVTTDSSGTAGYDIPTGKTYKLRADYLSQQYWSPVTSGQDVGITIPMSDVIVTVTGNGLSISGVKVYIFNSAGTYLNISGTTDAAGTVSFPIPSGIYKFRADYQAKQFWSQNETLNPDETKAIAISTGGGTFTLTVLKNQITGLANAKCYVFNQGGSPYLNLSGTTDSNGAATFSLADGAYQFRIDHLGYQFWTEVITIPDTLSQSLLIDHKNIAITLQGQLGTDISPIANIPVYLFTPSGTYLNVTQKTDTSGRVRFSLPDKPFLSRTDFLSQQFWSDAINYQDTAITIPEGIANIHVNINNQEIAGNRVYVYGETGTYLNVSALTDSNGIAEFRLPEATYTFRTDYQSQQLRVTAGIDRDLTTPVEITAPSTIFRLHADTGTGALADVRAYVFNEAGTYLNISGTTDAAGMVSFSLISGSYRMRLDYIGYQYWTDLITIPDATETVLSIPHGNRAVTVQGLYGVDSLPVADIPVYLFTPAGAYQGITRTTDSNGQALFFLPDAEYKLRADYLGARFWSAVFSATDTNITISEGIVRLIVTRAGVPVADAKVYLFSEAGSYLGRFVTTDEAGMAEFTLPDMSYKFRIDDAGQQHWSGVIDVLPDQASEIVVELQ